MLNTQELVKLTELADAAQEGDELSVLAQEDALANLSEGEFHAYLIARHGMES